MWIRKTSIAWRKFKMKTIFTLLLATIFTSAFAYDGGKLTITIASAKNVQVYVDGRAYQDRDNTYVMNNIQPGNHTIAIYRNGKNNGNGYGNNRNGRNDRKGDLVFLQRYTFGLLTM